MFRITTVMITCFGSMIYRCVLNEKKELRKFLFPDFEFAMSKF
jgi:hypothetical protein